MTEQRIIIIIPDSYEKEYAEKLYRRMKTIKYNVFMLKEDEYKKNNLTITDDDKLIFFGKARKIDERARTRNVRIKYDRFGMRYGWAGNICTIYASDADLPWKEWKEFVGYCTEMKKKYYDIQIPAENPIQENINAVMKKDNACYRCQYSALLVEFCKCGGLNGFLQKPNVENSAFKRITQQLPDNRQYDSRAAAHVLWKTLESRDGYKIEISNDKSFDCFRIVDRENNVIAWGKSEIKELGIMAFLALFDEKTIFIKKMPNTDKKHKVLYKTLDSLDTIEKVLDEADEALKNPERTIKDSKIASILVGAIPEVLAGFMGGGVGAAASFIALYYMGHVGLSAVGISTGLATAGGLVGGGMAAGIFVLGVPVAVLAGIGVAVVANIKQKELRQKKVRLLQLAIEKQQAIIEHLKYEVNAGKQRVDYLNSLNETLRRVINDLRADLENMA